MKTSLVFILATLIFNLFFLDLSSAKSFIVQSFSSRFALILGGYGPGYTELKDVDVVKHDKVCPNAIR